MRKPKYLSPTSVSKFYSDREEFYLSYMADNRPPRLPQTQPMAIGSAFDAFVKNYLVMMLHGKVDPRFEIEAIFEEQVEEHNRDWAFENGEHCFNLYKESGALADLMIELEHALEEPKFEFTVEGRVAHEDIIDGIPLLGKPDVFFITKQGNRVILDWKVNGYCSKRPTSPKKGYLKVRGGPKDAGQPHKDCQMMSVNGMEINIGHTLEDVSTDWADQLSIYMWILGEPVGTKTIVGIDQLCGWPQPEGMPKIRVATHRCRVSSGYQDLLMEKVKGVWQAVTTGQIFDEDNEAKCQLLDQYHKAFNDPEGKKEWEDWYVDVFRQHKY